MSVDIAKTTLIDISVPIFPGMPTYPGDPGVAFEPALCMDDGGPANVTRIHIGSQTGTHYDAPHHILNDHVSLDQMPLETFYGPAQVIELDDSVQTITASVLQRYSIGQIPKLLIKSRNSGFWLSHPTSFRTDYAALTGDGAAYLAAQGIRFVGVDYLSIELFESEGLVAHKTLMQHSILILEGVNLSGVTPGVYTLSAFPVPYKGLDGAPTRAILIQN